jgi:hypothetical protein
MMHRNSDLSDLCDKTYYFSYAEGIRKRNITKKREIFNEPKKLSNSAIGFNLDISHDLKYSELSQGIKQKPK